MTAPTFNLCKQSWSHESLTDALVVIGDLQKASTVRIPTRMASSAHRMHGQTSIAEATQLEADGPSPGRQPCHPQQHAESTGQGLSSLERA